MSDRTPNQQRLDKLQQQLEERGAALRHVSWAPGAENLDVEARRGELANFLEAWAQGKTKELFFLRHEILTGDELLERVRALEGVLNDIGELSRAGTDTLKKIGEMADAAAQGRDLLPALTDDRIDALLLDLAWGGDADAMRGHAAIVEGQRARVRATLGGLRVEGVTS